MKEELSHDFGPRLRKFLESKFNITIKPGPVRASLLLPSGIIIYVRGSKELTFPDRRYGYYHLVKNNYDDLVKSSTRYFAIVYNHPRNTFVLSSAAVKRIFEHEKLVYPPNRPPKWHFKIDKERDRFILNFDRKGTKKHDISQYLNTWDQIKDFSGKQEIAPMPHPISEQDNQKVNVPKHLKKWLALTENDVEEIIDIVLMAEGKRLEIDREVVKRIISHLIVSKHVILVGPPGTGKTDLGRRLLRELGKRIIGADKPVEAVASYEWGRYEVIGGNSIISISKENSFHPGCVTDAIMQKKFLLIDEFNRADMNKAFGEMFMAIEHGIIQLRTDETIRTSNNDLKEVGIPPYFRMICTMNDYDKTLLNDLSYGLLRRFAFVEINLPKDRQTVKEILIERVKGDLIGIDRGVVSKGLSKIQVQLDKFIDFMLAIKSKREIGLSSYIDVIRYLLHGVAIMRVEPWQSLNEALIDYILPQFDRLDTATLSSAYEFALDNFGDEKRKTPPLLDPFIINLKGKIERLQSLNKLFSVSE